MLVVTIRGITTLSVQILFSFNIELAVLVMRILWSHYASKVLRKIRALQEIIKIKMVNVQWLNQRV